jgi:hypothetical protein
VTKKTRIVNEVYARPVVETQQRLGKVPTEPRSQNVVIHAYGESLTLHIKRRVRAAVHGADHTGKTVDARPTVGPLQVAHCAGVVAVEDAE